MGLLDNLDGTRDGIDWVKKIKEIVNDLATLVSEKLEMERWGFKESYRFDKYPKGPFLIYDNSLCRVKIEYGIERYRWEDGLRILYGRKIAPNNEEIIEWNGEKCWCWHARDINPICFLDGYTPQEAINLHWPMPVTFDYENSDQGKKLYKANIPQYRINECSLIWQAYAPRLFELFDINNPTLWENYYQFNKEYWRLWYEESEYRKNNFDENSKTPTHDKIC